jgi:thiol-disulfide isomerase/thioredoxin
MAKARPALLTLALSGAAVLGYLSYRALIPSQSGEPAAEHAAGHTAAAPLEDTTAPPQPRLADTLPEFSLGNLAGEPQSISSWPGKPLLINFWATWCGPCLREIPMLKELQSTHADLQIVGIAVDRRDPVVAFAETMQFNYPILIGQSDAWEAAAAFGVNVYALPFTVFTAADGSILGVHTGELHAEHLDNLTGVLTELREQKIGIDEARARIAGRI